MKGPLIDIHPSAFILQHAFHRARHTCVEAIVRPESCELSKLVKGHPASPKAWERKPSFGSVSVMMCSKRR